MLSLIGPRGDRKSHPAFFADCKHEAESSRLAINSRAGVDSCFRVAMGPPALRSSLQTEWLPTVDPVLGRSQARWSSYNRRWRITRNYNTEMELSNESSAVKLLLLS